LVKIFFTLISSELSLVRLVTEQCPWVQWLAVW